MILVDTSVWIDHFRQSDQHLANLLNAGLALMHPFVLGELMLGNLRDRNVLALLGSLPQAAVARTAEVQDFIHAQNLGGSGIGYVDVHLLAATRLTPGATLWTRDKRLSAVALRDGLAAGQPG